MKEKEFTGVRLPGFTAESSLYFSDTFYKTKIISVLEKIAPQAFFCRRGSCFDCRDHTANDYEDDNTPLGPPSGGLWERCCNSTQDGFNWRRCSKCRPGCGPCDATPRSPRGYQLYTSDNCKTTYLKCCFPECYCQGTTRVCVDNESGGLCGIHCVEHSVPLHPYCIHHFP
jgi:hypothetical protein